MTTQRGRRRPEISGYQTVLSAFSFFQTFSIRSFLKPDRKTTSYRKGDRTKEVSIRADALTDKLTNSHIEDSIIFNV